MPTEVAKPPRVYPFEVEPNDPAKHRKRAGPDFDFDYGRHTCFPTHSNNGKHHWWVIDLVQASRRDRDDGGTVGSGESFEEATTCFKSCFEDETLTKRKSNNV
jgi:hypothetical protein